MEKFSDDWKACEVVSVEDVEDEEGSGSVRISGWVFSISRDVVDGVVEVEVEDSCVMKI